MSSKDTHCRQTMELHNLMSHEYLCLISDWSPLRLWYSGVRYSCRWIATFRWNLLPLISTLSLFLCFLIIFSTVLHVSGEILTETSAAVIIIFCSNDSFQRIRQVRMSADYLCVPANLSKIVKSHPWCIF